MGWMTDIMFTSQTTARRSIQRLLSRDAGFELGKVNWEGQRNTAGTKGLGGGGGKME